MVKKEFKNIQCRVVAMSKADILTASASRSGNYYPEGSANGTMAPGRQPMAVTDFD